MPRSAAVAVTVGIFCMTALTVALVREFKRTFDQYEVIGSEKDPNSSQHAVTYIANHSNSSNQLIFTYITRRGLLVGSHDLTDGSLALISKGLGPSVQPKWIDSRLTITVPQDAVQRRGHLQNCAFEYDIPKIICFAPSLVKVAVQVEW
jgi:hypothetical protein